jgi:UDPglucose 6-dehydrogenase
MAGIELKVLKAVEDANQVQKHVLGNKIKARFGEDLQGKHFALWGLAFKANTDDMREASSLTLIYDLLSAGATITAYDPVAISSMQRVPGDWSGLSFADSPTEALNDADALVIVTEWKEFRSPDFEVIKATLNQPVIFDGRNLYEPAFVRGMQMEYFPIGR